jgi:hypothetical protein
MTRVPTFGLDRNVTAGMLLLDLLRGAASRLIRDRHAAITAKLTERRVDDRRESSSFQQMEHQTFKQG